MSDRQQALNIEGDAWIVIPNWEQFQHYKDRRPTWIKIYVELLDDPDYLGLTFPQRGLLHGIWLLYALSRGKVRGNIDYLNRKLGGSCQKRSLAALSHAGFIEFSSSKPVSLRYGSAIPEVEKEIEKETPLPPFQLKNGKRGKSFVCPKCGVVHGSQQRLKEHVELVHA